ncbi:cytochrome P450 [Variovorax sp. RT4R15]|uniref:cytochrome P450 n=1 Tax=Variovorax sp. RT4R15 TaxID=3443737 RepID=UPI003F4491D8
MFEKALSRFGRWAAYQGVSAAIHQPRALRALAAAIQQSPKTRSLLRTVATRDDVVGVFERPLAFSNSAQRPNLVAGDFAIGMESGPRHACERALLMKKLQPPPDFAARASAESRRLVDDLRAGPVRRFDLVTDYMAPVVWQAMGGAFGAALPPLPTGDPVFLHLRNIGAHLIVGGVATDAVQRRARESAAQLTAWVQARLPALQTVWGLPGTAHREEVARNVVGMLWVGHPATVQSGVLLMQELLVRPKVLRDLAERVGRCTDPWNDMPLRELFARHVLELLRFRPPFPILRRDVPRDVRFGADGASRAAAGAQLTVMTIGALFDPAAHKGAPPEVYDPNRVFVHPPDRYLMFGGGQRHCIASEQVVEMLVSALIGLLQLPGVKWADPWWRRMRYDGPSIASAQLAFTD